MGASVSDFGDASQTLIKVPRLVRGFFRALGRYYVYDQTVLKTKACKGVRMLKVIKPKKNIVVAKFQQSFGECPASFEERRLARALLRDDNLQGN